MDLPIACTLNDHQRRDRESALRSLLGGAERVERLPGGISLRFAGDRPWLLRIAELATLERACCRFLRFEVDAEPDLGPIWLRVSGPPGTDDFLAGWIETP